MKHNVRTFTAITPDNQVVEVSTFTPLTEDRWTTLTKLTQWYPQLDGWGYVRDSEWKYPFRTGQE